MLVVLIDRDSDTPLHQQVADQIRDRVSGGFLPPGTRLPSTRALAHSVGVGRNTVVAAYDALLEEGWLDSATGRGTFVAEPRDGSTRADEASPSPGGRSAPFAWSRVVARSCSPPDGSAIGRSAESDRDTIGLARAVPDPTTYPADAIRRILQEVLRREGSRALGYGSPAGYPPLREFLAARATEHGTTVKPEDVLIVGGLQQGLDLVARLLVAPGDRVVVESPAYPHALQILGLYGAEVVPVPMNDGGIDPGVFAEVVARVRPKLASLMPTFQNPTGWTLDENRRRAIVRTARENDLVLLENHFDTDLRYRGVALPPLRAFDSTGQVVLLGTFSKILFPGFRLGWIIAPPEVRPRLLDIKSTCDVSTSLPAQMVVAEFCANGGLDRHLDRVRGLHAERLDAMIAAAERFFPSSVSFTRPEGGMTIWVTLPEGSRSSEILEEARRAGVTFAPGSWFFPEGEGERHLRLSFVGESPPRITTGVEILGRILTRSLRSRRRPRRRREEAAPFL